MPGDTYNFTNSTKSIEYLECANTRARLNVLLSDEIPEPQEIRNGFYTPPDAYISEAATGAWYNPAQVGQGFDIQIRNDRVAVYWYTFNEGDSARRWYYGTCIPADCMDGFTFYTTEQGTFANPKLRTQTVAGTGQLYFLADDVGMFNYDFIGYGRDAIPITAIEHSDSPLSGSWFNTDKEGSGFTLHEFPMGHMAGYWFTYGPQSTLERVRNKGHTQRWYLVSGYLNDSGMYDLTIYEAQGGRWRSYAAATLHPVGSAVVTVIGDRLKFSYELTDDHIDTRGSQILKRLF